MWGRKQIEAYLKQRVCDNDENGVFLSYGELYDLVGLTNKGDISQRNYVHDILGNISRDEAKDGRPLISVIVVRQVDNKPGPGFFELARKELPDQYTGLDDDTILILEFKKVIAYKQQYCG
ncbi:hypothetical protein G4Y79_04405 [Phototrophicus methaneseepsis]|uniref:Uncharacterized protein n=1 Tax=Phototrophicus methaneseepsis TaxID=2710758 RepID=A0A7S8EAZ9_9CHLR|nr:hypothetical protein [Phototrophicus methaneseepsis]QPC83631.1 hypothetical protein G4Y79_04405 [Phototrophicus methaneseepsis]